MENNRRLIDANALRKKRCAGCGTDIQIECLSDPICASLMWVDQEPTVDAVEVVHGRWVCTYDENRGETDVTCSHCNDTRTINGCYVTLSGESCYFEDNYCPHCGARMDGDANA